MGIFSRLRKMAGFEQQSTSGKNTSPCDIDIKISTSEFKVMARQYYRGYTSYKSFFNSVFLKDPKKTVEVMTKAQEKAEQGCYIDATIVKFYSGTESFIEIPFDVYSDKRDMTITMRNTKSWNRNNLLRILKLYPDFTKYDDSLISEKYTQK